MLGHVLCFLLLTGAMAYNGHSWTSLGPDLEGQVILFPGKTNNSFMSLKPPQPRSLEKFTVCMRFFTELAGDYSLFSLATARQANDILIYPMAEDMIYLYVDNNEMRVKIDKDELAWKHLCMTWDSSTGVVQLWVNGKPYPRRVSKKGYTIAATTSIILGQEQDSFGGGFDKNQCFVGEIRDFHMWNYVLTPEKLQSVLINQFHGNVLSWRSLNYIIQAEALLQPRLSCGSLNLYMPCSNNAK